MSNQRRLTSRSLGTDAHQQIVVDGEAMCGDSFDNLWNRAADEHVRLCAFDLLEIDGEDFRGKPLRSASAASPQLLRKDRDGLEYVDHL